VYINQEDLLSDAGLIELASQGDGAAWESLVRQHQEAVFRLAYLLLGDSDDAEDVAQDTFVRAYHAIGRFDAARPLRPWLLRIAANLAHNRRRSAGRYVAALQRFFHAEPRPKESVEGDSIQRIEAQALWRAVRRLPEADQQIIYLRYFLELPIDESAAVIGVAPGTVKSRLSRALDRLQTLIGRDFPLLQEGRKA
jgi:RNA polymerase sigma-70 factor (ECF subfamily)